jgi:serine/threonine-protein kinase
VTVHIVTTTRLSITVVGAAVCLSGCATARSAGVPLPRVVGDRAAAASTRLAAVGVKTVTLPQFSSKPRGVVISQGQPAGTRVRSGSTVALTVSAGVAHSTVPSLAGARAAAAIARLQSLHLAALRFTVFSEAPRGRVVSSFPGTGAAVGYDAQVRVDVSGGPPPAGAAPARVPDVRGGDASIAQQRLRALWLAPDLFYVSSSKPAGSVVRQLVAPGTRVRLGTLVGLALSLGPHGTAATPVPYVVGRSSAAAVGLLSSTGFHVRVVTQRSPAVTPPRSVVDEQPMGGTKAPAHAVVTIVIAA